MVKKIDLTGQRFGRLVVVEDSGERAHGNGSVMWMCLCDCGNTKQARGDHLSSGRTKSCGCIVREGLIQKKESGRVEGTRLSMLSIKTAKNNTSGNKGVSYNKRENKWKAYIQFRGKRIDIGAYIYKQDAIQARKEAEEKYFQPIIEKYGK